MVEEGQELGGHCRRIAAKGGRKSGESRRRKREFQDRVLDALNAMFDPPGKMSESYERLNLKEKGKRMSVFTAIVGKMVFDAMNGDHKARMDLFELGGLTPNARRNLAQAKAVERMLESAGCAADDRDVPGPGEIEEEIRKLGVYDA